MSNVSCHMLAWSRFRVQYTLFKSVRNDIVMDQIGFNIIKNIHITLLSGEVTVVEM